MFKKGTLVISLFFLCGFFIGPNDNTVSRVISSESSAIVGLDEGAMREIAENLYNVSKSMSTRYSVSDGLSLGVYLLRYMAEVGEYELKNESLMALIVAFENLMEDKIDPQVISAINQMEKLQFGKKSGKFFVKFFAKNKKRGVVVDINEISRDPKSSLREIKHAVIKDEAEIKFFDIKTERERKGLYKFITKRVKILGIFSGLASSLNQINKILVENIANYINSEETPAAPLGIEFDGVYVAVSTSTIFKGIKFYLDEGVALPGFIYDGEPVPSFVVSAKKGILKLKISIDQ